MKADTVILAMGLKVDHKLYNDLKTLPDIDVYAVGDYAEINTLYEAIHDGHITARKI